MKLLANQQDTIEFIRTCVDVSTKVYERESTLYGGGSPDEAMVRVDALGKLLVSLVLYQGEDEGAVKENKTAYLDRILAVVVIVLCNHQQTRPHAFHQKVFFRLFSTILSELHQAAKEDKF